MQLCILQKVWIILLLKKTSETVKNHCNSRQFHDIFENEGNKFDILHFYDFYLFFKIAVTEVTKPLVERINVQLTNSNVPLVTASKKV